jgi:hypothetical protein
MVLCAQSAFVRFRMLYVMLCALGGQFYDFAAHFATQPCRLPGLPQFFVVDHKGHYFACMPLTFSVPRDVGHRFSARTAPQRAPRAAPVARFLFVKGSHATQKLQIFNH